MLVSIFQIRDFILCNEQFATPIQFATPMVSIQPISHLILLAKIVRTGKALC